ncbi:MAG: DUF1801 domain-containing protein [Saprospiraceae bacterium]
MAKLAVIKTKDSESSVVDFINSVEDEQQRKDSFVVLDMMKQASAEEPKMWGAAMIGFGKKVYKSPASGREVEWFKIGFSPRKANLSLHLVFDMEAHADALQKLGKHKTGKGCLYINKLSDVDLKVLKTLMEVSMSSK